MLYRYSLIFLFVSISSCAGLGKSDADYTQPSIPDVKNSQVINQNFDDTWNRLIGNLSQKYFVINNVEKLSRIINVSFSTDSPEDYIDCGSASRTFIPGAGTGQPENYNYRVAAANTTYKIAMPNSQNPGFTVPAMARREMHLEGRTNIYVAPKEDKTEIKVNTRYILSGTVYYTSLINGANQSVKHPAHTFNTKTSSSNIQVAYGKTFNIKCVSKGVIESDIISAAQIEK